MVSAIQNNTFRENERGVWQFTRSGFYFSSVTDRIVRQGLPTATTFAGISLVTTLPAPIIALSPMVTPGRTVTLPPNHTLLPMEIGRAISINPAVSRCLIIF